MANFAALFADLPAEETAVTAFAKGIEKLVADAKANGFSDVAINDIEALVPDAQTVIEDTEKVVSDLE